MYWHKLNNTKNSQHDTQILAISQSYKDSCICILDSKNILVYIYHFHSSIIKYNSDRKHNLKVGALPTIYLATFVMNNEQFKEDSRYNSIVECAEDIEYISNSKM